MEITINGWTGCTTTFLWGFPYDADDTFTESQREQLEARLKANDLPKAHPYTRSWMAILCSQQLKTKELLEKYGWRCVVETKSGHEEKPASKHCNGGMTYIMFKEK